MLFPYVREREKLPFLPLPLDPGNFLLSQAVPSSVPSAFGGLTSVFGMGTGGALQLSSPETFPLGRSLSLPVRFASLSASALRTLRFSRSPLPAPSKLHRSELTRKHSLIFAFPLALRALRFLRFPGLRFLRSLSSLPQIKPSTD